MTVILTGWQSPLPKVPGMVKMKLFKGKVFAGGVNDRGEIEGHNALEEAYLKGKNL